MNRWAIANPRNFCDILRASPQMFRLISYAPYGPVAFLPTCKLTLVDKLTEIWSPQHSWRIKYVKSQLNRLLLAYHLPFLIKWLRYWNELKSSGARSPLCRQHSHAPDPYLENATGRNRVIVAVRTTVIVINSTESAGITENLGTQLAGAHSNVLTRITTNQIRWQTPKPENFSGRR